jgi:HAD superfamily hydrolase (TIGR01509 family)
MGNIKAVIFDFNGTMIFDSEFHRRVWYEFIPRYTGRRVSYEEINAKILGRDNASILKNYIGEHLSDREIEELTQEKEAAYRRLCLENKERFKFVDGLYEFLDYLKEKEIPITIATGSEISNLKFYFEYFELSRWFDFGRVIYDDGIFPGKPSPDIYLRAAAALSAEPATCLVFEDAHSGILAAHNAGIGYIVAVSETEEASAFASAGGVDLVTKNFLGYTRFLELKP